MIKNYTKENISENSILPSENSIQFLLSYSRSLHVFQTPKSGCEIEMNLN